MKVVAGRVFHRCAVRTRWLRESDDLAEILVEYAADRRPGDTVAVSEKVALLLSGRAIPVEKVPISRDARFLSRFVRPHHDTLGLSIPVKMEWVLRQIGRPRVYAAALVAGMTRPFGLKGMFFHVAGDLARTVDGGTPPYDHLLFPPFPVDDATTLCAELEAKLDSGVAIVDINDFGGSVRAVSPRALPADILARVLADNPLGQRSTGRPFVLVRPN
ncbi:hypothetical protein [Actinopolymorpha alba]|uniref:hypothetical protein n=1 Tax=Actinopolymorpha alba TaxID=533267 RepID=UPI00035E5DEB|nr:hypothetical protein [Actinopolymorpha alba]